MKKEPICICKGCIKSSHADGICVFEDKEKMAFCPTYMKHKPRKGK